MKKTMMLFLAVTALPACSESPTPEVAQPAAATSEPQSSAPVTARVHDGRSLHDTAAIIAAYRAETGLVVDWAGDDAASADVVIVGSFADLWTAAEADKFRPVYSETINQAIPAHFLEAESRWAALSYQARSLVYNRDLVSESEVASLSSYTALADAHWHERVCLSSSQVGGNRLLIAYLIKELGKRDAELAVRGWRANFAEPPFENDEALLAAMGEGRCAIGIAGVGLLRADRGLTNLEALFFDEGQLIDISAAAVSRHAANPADARAFVEWLVDGNAMSLIALHSFQIPVAEHARPGAAVQADATKLGSPMNLSELSFLIEEADLLIERARYP